MAKTMRMTNNGDASSMERVSTCENGGVAHWPNLNHDVLLLVMMQLGAVDFLAFSRVCKSWRSLALSDRSKFIASINMPMCVSISSDDNEKKCYLEDVEGSKFKFTIPNSADRKCIGVTCGYLILYSEGTRDFWLVNPITMNELQFPAAPSNDHYHHESFKANLVFSPSISAWVFVVVGECYYHKIWFCVAGERKWTHVSTPFRICDVHAFKGKIYTIDCVDRLCEMRLYPTPKLTLLETKNFTKPEFNHPVLVSWGENLYVMDRCYPFKIQEINLSKMEFVSHEKIGEQYAFFLSYLQNGAAVIPTELFANFHSHYRRYPCIYHKVGKGRYYCAHMWYFLHDCLDVNRLHE